MLSEDNAKRPGSGASYDPYAASLRGERDGTAGEEYDRPLSAADGVARPVPAPDPVTRTSPAPGDSDTPSPVPDAAPDAVGELRVRVTTARGALPVPGAHVLVTRCGEGGVCAACETDESGLSRLFILPTESAVHSLIGVPPPCARYDVEVIAEGFEPASFSAVPVYEGVTSVQCAELIPRPAGGARRE